jgi:hypothetical protein
MRSAWGTPTSTAVQRRRRLAWGRKESGQGRRSPRRCSRASPSRASSGSCASLEVTTGGRGPASSAAGGRRIHPSPCPAHAAPTPFSHTASCVSRSLAARSRRPEGSSRGGGDIGQGRVNWWAGQYVSNFGLLTGRYVWPKYPNYLVLFFYGYFMNTF